MDSSKSVLSVPDWDEPFTDQELEAIEAAFSSATASSPTKNRHENSNFDIGVVEGRQKARRRLPESIVGRSTSSAFVSDRRGIGFASGLRKRYRPQSNVMMRYPIINFGGHIVYSKTLTEVEKAATELLKFVEAKKREKGQAILGFDIEWRPTFRKGVSPGKAAVMQICGDTSHCYVMHIFHSGIPQNLQYLLEDPTSIKVGLGIANDCTKVYKDHNVSIKDLEDLSSLANRKFGGEPKKWSLQSLTEKLTCKQLEKLNRIKLGNWEADVLSKAQLQYAATDAFVSWHLYQMLKSFPDATDDKTEEQQGVLP